MKTMMTMNGINQSDLIKIPKAIRNKIIEKIIENNSELLLEFYCSRENICEILDDVYEYKDEDLKINDTSH